MLNAKGMGDGEGGSHPYHLIVRNRLFTDKECEINI